MFVNSYADEGTTGWKGGHSVTTITLPDGNNVFKVYSSGLVNNRQFFYQTDDEMVASAQRVQAYGAGQYLVTLDVMSGAYDDETPALTNLSVGFKQKYNANNELKADQSGPLYQDAANGQTVAVSS